MVATVSGLLPQNGAWSEITALPVGSILTLTPSGELVSAKPGLLVQHPELGRAEHAALLAGGDADADVAPLPARLLLLSAPALVVQQLERLVEHGRVVAAVVEIAGRDEVRKILGLDQVLAPELDRVEAELVDRGVRQALDHEVRDLGAEAAIGALLALVGQHRGDVDLDAADLVRPDDLRERVAVMADPELEIGAVVVDHLAAQAGHAAVRIERELGVVDPIASRGCRRP